MTPDHTPAKHRQIASRKENSAGFALDQASDDDHLRRWLDAYFRFQVTTAASSRAVQARDIERFLAFMQLEEGHLRRPAWSPRLSRAFVDALRAELTAAGRRRYADRTINRMIAHLKTFASWINRHRPFPLGHPTARLPALPTTSLLIEERALTPAERRRLLDAADLLIQIGGRSRDRHRHRGLEARPQRRGYRPWRNRAIVYLLIEAGLRRSAVTQAMLAEFDVAGRAITVLEKGGLTHAYKISREGVQAIVDYLTHERPSDATHQHAPCLFLPAATIANARDRLSPRAINRIWNQIATVAAIDGKTPHSARHAMGRHIIDKTGNLAAVQRQLGHKNAVYSMQYARITEVELEQVLDER
jgi:site-specific recombinase XerD